MRMLHVVILAAAVAVTARAPPERTIVVLPIALDDTSAAARLQSPLEEAVASAHVDVIGAAQLGPALASDLRCSSDVCREGLVEAHQADYLLRTTVAHTDAVWRISVELVALREGATVARASDACEICGLTEVGEMLGNRAATVVGRLRDLDAEPPMLAISTTPSGAHVVIDGRRVGLSPLRHQVTSGTHVIEVALSGHVAQRRQVEATAGVEVPVRLDLEVDRPSRDHARPRLAWGAAALATGAVLIAAGGGVVALDGREYRRECMPDIDGRCKRLYETTAAGITLLVSGALVAITGAALVGTARRHRGGSRRDAAIWRGLAWRF